jgi:hypothetical protein
VAMMVVLLDEANGEFSLRQDLVANLSQLAITNVALVRDERTVGIVLEGWLFDPARSAGAVAEAFGTASQARTLHPVLNLAVSTAAHEGGQDVREIPSGRM